MANEVVHQKPPIVVLRERLEARANELKAALAEIPPERFVRAVITAAQINPDILAVQWNSLWLACMRACRDGLLPDGVQGAIVPYKDKATWVPMYQGLIKRFQDSGRFKWITAGIVYEGDEFDHWIDEHGEHFRHRPSDAFENVPITKVYAMATTKDGGNFITVMPIAEINKIRKISRATREDAPWNAHFTEMAKKTALRRLAKLLPTAPIAMEEYEQDDEPEADSPVRLAASTPRPHGAAAALDAFAGYSETQDTHETSQASASEDQAKPPSVPTDAGDGGAQAARESAASHPEQSAAVTTQSDPVTVAYDRGKEAKAAKHARAALPGEYRSSARDAEAEAWLAGYDGKPKPGANP